MRSGSYQASKLAGSPATRLRAALHALGLGCLVFAVAPQAEAADFERAPFELSAFAQVELAPGASQRVALPIRIADLAVYVDGGWRVEPSTVDVAAGIVRELASR